jgi:hypothetical protein
MTYPITAKHFRLFKREVLRLWKLWEMSGWELAVEHHQIGERVFANCGCNPGQRSIRIRLSKTSEVPVTEASLLDSARHEMCHAVVEPLDSIGCCRYVTEDEINAASHEVLRRLMKVLPK